MASASRVGLANKYETMTITSRHAGGCGQLHGFDVGSPPSFHTPRHEIRTRQARAQPSHGVGAIDADVVEARVRPESRRQSEPAGKRAAAYVHNDGIRRSCADEKLAECRGKFLKVAFLVQVGVEQRQGRPGTSRRAEHRSRLDRRQWLRTRRPGPCPRPYRLAIGDRRGHDPLSLRSATCRANPQVSQPPRRSPSRRNVPPVVAIVASHRALDPARGPSGIAPHRVAEAGAVSCRGRAPRSPRRRTPPSWRRRRGRG